MSYDISLYARGFLKRAIEDKLGDWTDADPIPPAAVEDLVTLARASGFESVVAGPNFVEFCREQGVAPPDEFALDTPAFLAHLSLHSGQLAFSIPYSPRAEASIALCADLARTAANRHDLAFHDPQEGVADY
ncbi:MAG: hypothetical protein QM756_36280 [Polyangiaceae bacterium]